MDSRKLRLAVFGMLCLGLSGVGRVQEEPREVVQRADIERLAGPCPEFLSDSLVRIRTIQVGSTRADLLKLFHPSGGISTRYRQRFDYRDSFMIHVDVDFEVIPGGPPSTSDQDRIKAISAPFLAEPISD
jgi:hypothetical protein